MSENKWKKGDRAMVYHRAKRTDPYAFMPCVVIGETPTGRVSVRTSTGRNRGEFLRYLRPPTAEENTLPVWEKLEGTP